MYYKLLHTFGDIQECLQNEYFLSKENKMEHSACDPVNHFKKRFTDGKLDIFIPFDHNYNIIKCKELIYQQKDIEKCNIYFISINAGLEAENIVYHNFIPLNDTKLSFWFLKANSIEEGLKIFSNISFLENKLLILNYDLLSKENLFDNNNLFISKKELNELCNEE